MYFEFLTSLFSPIQMAAVALFIILVFAPGLLPPIGRGIGRLLRREMFRRMGVQEPPKQQTRHVVNQDVEIISPSAPQVTLRAGSNTSLASKPEHTRHIPLLWTFVLVLMGVAGVLWLLLHAR